MRNLPGTNQVHKANTDYHPGVVMAIRLAQATKTPDQLGSCLSGAKTLEDTTDRMEWEMPKELQNSPQEIGISTDPVPLVVDEVDNGYEEIEDEER